MAEIVNLRRARKAKVREDAAAKADGNRVKYGRTKAEDCANRRKTARRKEARPQPS